MKITYKILILVALLLGGNYLKTVFFNYHVEKSLKLEREPTFYELQLVEQYQSFEHDVTLTLDGRYISESLSSHFQDQKAIWHFNTDGTFTHVIKVHEQKCQTMAKCFSNNDSNIAVSGTFSIEKNVVKLKPLAGYKGTIPTALIINKKQHDLFIMLPGGIEKPLIKVGDKSLI